MTNHETLDMKLSFKDRLIATTNLNDLVEVFADHHHAYKVIDPQFITASFLVQESPITNILREPDLKLNLKYVEDCKEWEFELYRDQVLRHRKRFYENGQLLSQEYWLNDQRHRQDQVLRHRKRFYENGQPKYQEWRLNGQLHRVNGPAFELFGENGHLRQQSWYLDGQRLSEEDWLKAVQSNSLNF